MHTAVLFSGGMDSFLVQQLFYPRAIPVFVETRASYNQIDLDYARAMCDHLGTDLQILSHASCFADEDYTGIIEHRNAQIILLIAQKMDVNNIVVSSPLGELTYDQSNKFRRAMSRALQIRITNGAAWHTKAMLIAHYARRYGRRKTEHMLSRTRSCYSFKYVQCGRCSACVKRWVAMTLNGFTEEYEENPEESARYLYRTCSAGQALRLGLLPLIEILRVTMKKRL